MRGLRPPPLLMSDPSPIDPQVYGLDASITQVLGRLLGLPEQAGVFYPEWLRPGPSIPGESAEQARFRRNRFQRDIGMDLNQMEWPKHGLKQTGPMDMGTIMGVRRSNLPSNVQEEAVQHLRAGQTDVARRIVFPDGPPGVEL